MSDVFTQWFLEAESELEQIYFQLLRFPSISADVQFRPQLQACASWLVQELSSMGFEISLFGENDAPIIFASHMKASSDKPTLLIYNHYDVQPVDPLELWQSDPFEPQRKGNLITARGAQDNKGQLMYVLAALRETVKQTGELGINVKLCIEGQEESGSEQLSQLLSSPNMSSLFKADYLLIADFGMPAENSPAITLGMRGITAWTVVVESSAADLHSGTLGGIVYNPLHALVEILAKLRDSSGRIAIPGFYDTVLEPDASELSCLSFDFDEEAFVRQFQCEPTGGEKSFSPLERAWLRPTVEINGVHGGYGGPGTKTVIPARAEAKITARLVPGQDPHDIAKKLKHFVEAVAPKGVRVECQIHEGMGMPMRTSPHSRIVQLLSESTKEAYGISPRFILEGASIPIAAQLQQKSGAEVALFGLGLPSDNIHAPNECFGWDRIRKGFCIICALLKKLADKAPIALE